MANNSLRKRPLPDDVTEKEVLTIVGLGDAAYTANRGGEPTITVPSDQKESPRVEENPSGRTVSPGPSKPKAKKGGSFDKETEKQIEEIVFSSDIGGWDKFFEVSSLMKDYNMAGKKQAVWVDPILVKKLSLLQVPNTEQVNIGQKVNALIYMFLLANKEKVDMCVREELKRLSERLL